MFWITFLVMTAVFLFGYWYRGWKHNIEVDDQEGEYLGG